MTDKTYNILKRIFTTLILVSGVMIGIDKIWAVPMLTPIAGTISVIAYAGLEYLQGESNKFFTSHDIVEMGHITFLNPELHKEEEEEDPAWKL